MYQNNFTDAEVDVVASEIKWVLANSEPSSYRVFQHPPSLKVINSVISLGTNYANFVKPRLRNFSENHPDVTEITELNSLISEYDTPIDFSVTELNLRHKGRAKAICFVTKKLCEIIRESPTLLEEEAIKQWVIRLRPEDYKILRTTNFSIVGFQWLRMLFGADTSKPDKHIKNFLYNILNRKIKEIDAVYLMEAAVSKLGEPIRETDHLIWYMRARWDSVKIAPHIYEQFPNDVSINRALEFILEKKES